MKRGLMILAIVFSGKGIVRRQRPGAGHDELQYTRVHDNGEEGALYPLDACSTSVTNIEIVRGNLQVHNR